MNRVLLSLLYWVMKLLISILTRENSIEKEKVDILIPSPFALGAPLPLCKGSLPRLIFVAFFS